MSFNPPVLRLRPAWRPSLTWRLDYHRVRLGGPRSHLGVADLAAEKSRVYKRSADERWYRPPSPTHERAQSEYSENVREDVCLVAHVRMGVYVFATNSGESVYGFLRRIAAKIGRCAGDGGSDENHESRTPENVARCKIRRDEQRQREQRSEDRCMVNQQMEMRACKHGVSCWVAPTFANWKPRPLAVIKSHVWFSNSY
jgi:hypothetical protein